MNSPKQTQGALRQMSQTQYSILIVDDDPVNRDMLGRRLAREGYGITHAENGAQALEIMAMERFDLVLLDIQMPGMDGIQVLDAMQSDSQLKRTTVIMTTALNNRESVVRCIQRGAADYLVKPFEMARVKARIWRCLQAREHAMLLPALTDETVALGATVLIVEDNALNLDLLARRMRELGCAVTESGGAEDALKLLDQHDYDLVLLDVQMQGMSGIELLGKMKFSPRHRHTPVLMVSAQDDSSTMGHCFELGATDYIRKPITLPLLKARVLSTLRAKRAADRNEDLKSS